MKTLFLDFESLYDQKTYTLRHMTPVEYILDPRWETIGLAAAEGMGEVQWIEGPQVPAYLQSKNPDEYAVVHHNALFDACISAYRYNWVPRLTLCTLAMARAMLFYRTGSVSLATVAEELGVGEKGTEIVAANAMTLAMLKANPAQYAGYVRYAKNDVELCRAAYYKMLADGFPVDELSAIDMITRCATQPQFEIDVDLVARHLHKTIADKQLLLTKAMLSGVQYKDELTSRDQFAGLLASLGVDVPRKISKTTGKATWALAKTDPEFKALEEHESPAVQAIVAARLGHQSTLEETRSQRFINIGSLEWPNGKPKRMPMPLRYSGAHTHRLSGEWKINVQNLRRGGELRKALRAPEGYMVMAGDLSQVEARLTAWLCGCNPLIERFAAGDDVYSWFASSVYQRPITKADKNERFMGKTCILGLGFGMGWERFRATVRVQSNGEVVIDEAEACRIVDLYRGRFPEIKSAWRFLNSALRMMQDRCFWNWGPVRFEHEKVILPNKLMIHYRHLTFKEGSWICWFGKQQKWLHGGLVLENIVQALARIIVMDAAIRLKRALAPGAELAPGVISPGIPLALQVHDELVYIVPEHLTSEVKEIMLREMQAKVEWAPGLNLPVNLIEDYRLGRSSLEQQMRNDGIGEGLGSPPLGAEVGIGKNYAEAK